MKLPFHRGEVDLSIPGLLNMSFHSRHLKLPFDKKGEGSISADTWSAKYEL